jgi:hypothetical protein
MMPNMQLLALNQQFQQGCLAAQQGLFAEQAGNWPLAAQSYDQSIAIIGNAMFVARQSGIPILDNVYASLAVCHFQAARAKAAAGWAQLVPAHLTAASQAINQAIILRPDVPQYRAAAAIVHSAQIQQPQQDASDTGKATPKQWVDLATTALKALNTFANQGATSWSW